MPGTEINHNEIVGLTCDSRRVEPGYLFAALPGSRVDGRAYISEAVKRGAAAVLAPPGTRHSDGSNDLSDHDVTLIIDDNPRRRFSQMAARFFNLQPRTVALVTGTNGKTSVVSFLRQIWTEAGHGAASLGTLGLVAPGRMQEGELTTPDPVTLHKILRDLARDGVERLALEASSQGLDQYRLDGVDVSAAAFTNLSRDHLDYHGTMEDYLESKKRLFVEVMKPGGVAVLNADEDWFEALSQTAGIRRQRVVSFGRQGGDIRLESIRALSEGQKLELTVMGVAHGIVLPLMGGFQAQNALCALGLALACGEDAASAVRALEKLEGAPGRMQKVASLERGGSVYVDYAHTPAALAAALSTLRPHAEAGEVGRLHLVFGCGGDRDKGKRPEMGRIAHDLADAVIVTDDNPRGENPQDIRRQVLGACAGALEIGDRAEAIGKAVSDMDPGDILIITGKGVERGQIVGDEVHPFNDVEVARAFAKDSSS